MPDDDKIKKVRGDTLNTWLKYIHKKWGVNGEQTILKKLKRPNGYKDKDFYPMTEYEELLQWVRIEHGEEHLFQGGKFIVANYGLLGWFFRFLSIKLFLDKIPKSMKEFFNFGHAEVVILDDNHIQIRIYEICTTHDVCKVIVGSCTGALEMTKTPGTMTETKCVHDGEDFCEFTFKGE